jgi:hypothetical protein
MFLVGYEKQRSICNLLFDGYGGLGETIGKKRPAGLKTN